MNPPLQITIGSADPNANPITVNELFALLQTVISGEIIGSYTPYILGHDTPSVDDQDKAWIELDTAGRAIAIKTFYAGAWRRVYNGMIGEIRGYSGDPSADFNQVNGVYTSGKVGERYDGWYLCNGLNGTPNLSDKFLLGAAMDNVGKDGYSNGWQAAITGPDGTVQGYKTGGRFIETLIQDNLPLLSNAVPGDAPGLWIYGKEGKDGTSHPDAVPLVDTNYANLKPNQVNLTQNLTGGEPGPYGKNPPTPVWTTPPFVALGWIQFKGY